MSDETPPADIPHTIDFDPETGSFILSLADQARAAAASPETLRRYCHETLGCLAVDRDLPQNVSATRAIPRDMSSVRLDIVPLRAGQVGLGLPEVGPVFIFDSMSSAINEAEAAGIDYRLPPPKQPVETAPEPTEAEPEPTIGWAAAKAELGPVSSARASVADALEAVAAGMGNGSIPESDAMRSLVTSLTEVRAQLTQRGERLFSVVSQAPPEEPDGQHRLQRVMDDMHARPGSYVEALSDDWLGLANDEQTVAAWTSARLHAQSGDVDAMRAFLRCEQRLAEMNPEAMSSYRHGQSNEDAMRSMSEVVAHFDPDRPEDFTPTRPDRTATPRLPDRKPRNPSPVTRLRPRPKP